MIGRRLNFRDIGSLVCRCKGTRLWMGDIDLSYVGNSYERRRLEAIIEDPLGYQIQEVFREKRTGEYKRFGDPRIISDPRYLDDWINLDEYKKSHGRKGLKELNEDLEEYARVMRGRTRY